MYPGGRLATRTQGIGSEKTAMSNCDMQGLMTGIPGGFALFSSLVDSEKRDRGEKVKHDFQRRNEDGRNGKREGAL